MQPARYYALEHVIGDGDRTFQEGVSGSKNRQDRTLPAQNLAIEIDQGMDAITVSMESATQAGSVRDILGEATEQE